MSAPWLISKALLMLDLFSGRQHIADLDWQFPGLLNEYLAIHTKFVGYCQCFFNRIEPQHFRVRRYPVSKFRLIYP